MSKVYRHKPMSPDELLGHVEPDGKVYESRFGPDKYVGRVDPDTGQIYEARLGPDKHIGRVALDNGKVYRAKLGPDEYLGRADSTASSIATNRWRPTSTSVSSTTSNRMPTPAPPGCCC